jgi:hypothetical protein
MLEAYMDSREHKNDPSESQIASRGEINSLFRSKMSEIAYAWNVVIALGDVEAKFLQQGNVTVSQVEEIENNLSRILQDSSCVNEALAFVRTYLASGDLENFLTDTKKLADIVDKVAVAINFAIPTERAKALFLSGMSEINFPASRISIERNIRSAGEYGPSAQMIEVDVTIKSLVTGIWKQEVSRLSRDFRVIKSNSAVIFELACADCSERLKKLCGLLRDVLSLRSTYEISLKNFFGGQGSIPAKKEKIIGRIERKLADLIDQKNTFDAVEIYTALRPVLLEAVEGIKKHGRLRRIIASTIAKQDALLMPVVEKSVGRQLGL